MRLTYLLDEICAGLEIYYSGRAGGQYFKSAFVLCDDYVELTAKLYLITAIPGWADTGPNGRFKNFHTVLAEAVAEYERTNGQSSALHERADRMKERRTRRNEFFHSTRLLDLNVTQRMCVEAFVDLIDFGEALFSQDWPAEAPGSRNLETLVALVRLEQRCFAHPHLLAGLQDLMATWPRNKRSAAQRGLQVAVHPEDLHLRLCVINGASDFRDRVLTLLNS